MPVQTRKTNHAEIAARILVLRGQRLLLDSDLAELYKVSTKSLNQAVRRNKVRFPVDFGFSLSRSEIHALRNAPMRAGPQEFRNRRYPPFAFTEHGAIMAATILNSPRAVEMSVYVVRAFIKLRQILASNADLARKLHVLEKSMATLDARTRKQFEEVYGAIRALMKPAVPVSRPIDFTADLD